MRQVEIVEKNYNWPPPSPAVLWIQNVEWKKNQIEKKTTNKSKTIKVKLLCVTDSKERSPPGAIFPGFFRNLHDNTFWNTILILSRVCTISTFNSTSWSKVVQDFTSPLWRNWNTTRFDVSGYVFILNTNKIFTRKILFTAKYLPQLAHISEKRLTSLNTDLFRLVAISRKTLLKIFHDGGHYHIEASPLICSANQWTGFYMITASVMKELIWSFCVNKYRFTLFHSTHRHNKQWS